MTPGLGRPSWLASAAPSVNGDECSGEELTFVALNKHDEHEMRLSSGGGGGGTTPLAVSRPHHHSSKRKLSRHLVATATSTALNSPSMTTSPSVWRDEMSGASTAKANNNNSSNSFYQPPPTPQYPLYQQQAELINSLKNLTMRQQERIYSSGTVVYLV